MHHTPDTILVSADTMRAEFTRILLKEGFAPHKAAECATIFTESSVDGVYTHGVNRFPLFVRHLRKGYMNKDAEPLLKNRMGALEQWDGLLGPGPLNAVFATSRAMQLADEYGMGCVALANTNHWMRGGTYGWQAAKKGYAFIGFTNTIANMPAWGGVDRKLGNNPLVIALPFQEDAVVLDMAMSQYSIGSLQQAAMKGEQTSVAAGFDETGNLTNDPEVVIASKRVLPMGYWKGSGLALLLDMLAAVLSGGLATWQISKKEAECQLSQVYIAINLSSPGMGASISAVLENIINDYHSSVAVNESSPVIYPGERVVQARARNLEKGVPVLRSVWEEVRAL